MVFLSVLSAGDFEGGFLASLMTRSQPHAEPDKHVDKDGKALEHAKVENSAVAVSSQAEALEGQQEDIGSVLSNTKSKVFESADISSSDARDELRKEETIEDLSKYPIVSGQGSNEDESLNKAALDLKLLNPNPEGTNAVRNAEPTVAAATVAA